MNTSKYGLPAFTSTYGELLYSGIEVKSSETSAGNTISTFSVTASVVLVVTGSVSEKVVSIAVATVVSRVVTTSDVSSVAIVSSDFLSLNSKSETFDNCTA